MIHIMNILVTIDKKYIEPLVTMLRSLTEHNIDRTIEVYIAHRELTDADITYIAQCTPKLNIHCILISDSSFSGIPVLERLNEESFYRLLAFEFLPRHIDRCLYLDPDIIVTGTLSPLYDMDMGNNYVAAASHVHGFTRVLNSIRLGLRGNNYLNSGVMLLNLNAIRSNLTSASVLESLKRNRQKLIMGDQDMVNILFGQKHISVSAEVYNLNERSYKYYSRKHKLNISQITTKTAVIHYTGKYKPWNEGYKGVLDIFYPEVREKGKAPKGTSLRQIRSILNILGPTVKQLAVIILIILCLFSYFFFGDRIVGYISASESSMNVPTFILLRTLQTVIKIIPAEPMEVYSGYTWGTLLGTAYCVIGNTLGSIISLFLGKKYSKLFRFKNIRTITKLCTSNNIYAVLFTLYMLPGVPKDAMTYVAGMLPVKPAAFLTVTGIARIPSLLLSTLCGADLASGQLYSSISIFLLSLLLMALGYMLYRKCILKDELSK